MFSPRYFRARAEQDADPLQFCAFNVAVYGRRSTWAFSEYRALDIERQADSFALGRNRLAWQGDRLCIDIDELAAPLGGRVRGRIELSAPRRYPLSLSLDAHGRHRWWPVAPSASIRVTLEQPDVCFDGSGYHDANWGAEPLEDGFASWSWSRSQTDDGAAVLYDAIPRVGPPRTRGLRFRADRIEPLVAPQSLALPASGWGMPRSTRGDAGTQASVVRTLDDSPFYTRSLVRSTVLGQPRLAVHESLDLDQFTRPRMQLMLPFRMRPPWRAPR